MAYDGLGCLASILVTYRTLNILKSIFFSHLNLYIDAVKNIFLFADFHEQ